MLGAIEPDCEGTYPLWALGYASGQPPPRGPALDRRRWVDAMQDGNAANGRTAPSGRIG